MPEDVTPTLDEQMARFEERMARKREAEEKAERERIEKEQQERRERAWQQQQDELARAFGGTYDDLMARGRRDGTGR